jgi:hypothetical protein
VTSPSDKNESKFTLDGSLKQRERLSTYVDHQVEISKRKPRITIAVLALLCTVFFIWGAISQYKMLSQKAALEKMEYASTLLDKANQSLKKKQQMRDSLENTIYKLRTANEILAENTEPPEGVFFEVQLGSFTDFDISQYTKNLAALRQEKYDGKTKLLLGRFRSFKKALIFENDLKRMGISNAFLVGRIDSKIVTYREALDALELSNN